MKALTNIGIYPTENVQVQKTIQQVFNEVLQILLKHVNLEAVYCFSFQSHSCNKQNMIIQENCQNFTEWQLNLLLIGENIPSNASADLTDIVYQHTKGEVKLTLLCYSSKQISQSHNQHKRLFSKIIRSGWLVYGKPCELAPIKLANLPALDYKGIIIYTENRLKIAESLLKHTPLFFDQPLIAAYMIHTIMEQLCLGILYAFIYYHPKQFHIPYLLQLCKSCCGLPDEIILDRFLQQERLDKLLKTSASDLRFRSSDIFSIEDIEALYGYCASLSDQLVPVIEEQLQTLNSKYHEKEKTTEEAKDL